jgi:NAD(P)-dependent dehydrogenase (short-subunit alcohol dehydrogenase family)
MTGRMQGRACVVTGASSGIGLEIARGLARDGARVTLVCRNPARADAAAASIRRDVADAALDVVLADLSLQAQVRSAAAAIRSRGDRLHVLVNNAGTAPLRRRETAEGIEEQLAVNHLAPFLLTHLLSDLLVRSAPSRVVNVTSVIHRMARIDLDDLQARRAYRLFGLRQYGATKLMDIHVTREFARRLEGTGVTVNCVHPGDVATRIWPWWLRPLTRLLMRTPAEGARGPLALATDPTFDGVTGRYFHGRREAQPSAAALDPDLAARVWAATAALCGVDPERDLCAAP